MNATEFKKEFAEKTRDAFDKTGDTNLHGDEKTWDEGIGHVLSAIGRKKNLAVRRQESVIADIAVYHFLGKGEDPQSPKVIVTHSVQREKYDHKGTQAILDSCIAERVAPLRVVIGYADNPDEAFRHGELLMDEFIEQGGKSLDGELLLIIGWNYFYAKKIGWYNFGWQMWSFPCDVQWRHELAWFGKPEKWRG